ncbi:hypothetical protein [Actinoplanes italicus]|uniref:Putative membrane protein YesL n=1 Tax=Actinoplanes italicus TaxID=113567 RepID=A0A2T0JUA1_9ACTN|nr:hypothetical protein [Actinoplanes italicus]PRX11017.1 putative membrane protein YesL [Actinoplanes italicus]
MDWPREDEPEPRPDWRERFALGADLALIGIVVTVAALPVLTLPAALAAGSTAVRHRYTAGRMPEFRPLLRQFRRSLLPGLPFILVAALLLMDLLALSRGLVPGGMPVLVVTVIAASWLAGLAALTLVALGREPETSWRSALRWAWKRSTTRPWVAFAPALAGILAFFLALSVPATIPLVIGFHLFAAHVISDRLAPPLPGDDQPTIRGGHHPSA